MLEGDIQIRADLVLLHHLKQGGSDLFRVSIKHSDPTDPRHTDQPAEEFDETVFSPFVAAKICRILGDQVDFPDAAGAHLPGFGNNRSHTPGTITAFDHGNSTKRAFMRTALGDFEICPGRRSGQHARRVLTQKKSLPAWPEECLLDGFDDMIEILDSQPDINLRVAALQLVPIPLHEAAGHGDDFPFILMLDGEGALDRLFGFFPGSPDEPAGVEDEDIGLLRLCGQPITRPAQVSEHNFAIHKILGAAVADEGGRFAGMRCRHSRRTVKDRCDIGGEGRGSFRGYA
jgi:hypothetical protein